MNFNIDVVWIALISAFVIGAFLGAIAMAMFDLQRDDRAFQRGMAKCPRIHEWEDIG